MSYIDSLVDDLDKLSPEQLRARYEEIIQIVSELQHLQSSAGWIVLRDLLSANAENLRNDYADAQFSDLGGAFTDQHKKGLVRGLLRVEPLLSESIEYYTNFRSLIATLLEETSDGSSSERSAGFSGSDRDPLRSGDPSLNGGSFAP